LWPDETVRNIRLKLDVAEILSWPVQPLVLPYVRSCLIKADLYCT